MKKFRFNHNLVLPAVKDSHRKAPLNLNSLIEWFVEIKPPFKENNLINK